VPLREFYKGVRQTVMRPDEMLVDIRFPALEPERQRGMFIKLGLRRAQAISIVHAAAVISMTGEKVERAAITLGAVMPTIVHAHEAEDYLAGNRLDEETIEEVARLAVKAAKPIDDVRGSAAYRTKMIAVCVKRMLTRLAKDEKIFPENPVLLDRKNGQMPVINASTSHPDGAPIQTSVNGKPYTFSGGDHKTLLRLLREDALLIGTKEGCAEGECGACTVYLDGAAVMSCLVPAPRAHGAEIQTIEGLAQDGRLHPVQQAFIDDAAVQCGYCTPGFLMSGAKLLEERPRPSKNEIEQAITGNLCRCTGYYKIIEAIQHAAEAR
jgi:carbon-monoxide dehydrogenase medium subunit